MIAATQKRRGRQRGQSLIEFAILLPVLLLLLDGLLEFGFIFEHNLTLEYATREGARVAASLVNGGVPIGCTTTQPNWQNVDPLVIAAVERVLDSPGSEVVVSRVSQIVIFKANGAGADTGTHNVWTYNTGGTVKAPCAPSSDPALVFSDGSYPSSDTWPASTRSNTSPTYDAIGVRLTYTYQFVTPLAKIMGFFGGGSPTVTMTDQSVMVANPPRNVSTAMAATTVPADPAAAPGPVAPRRNPSQGQVMVIFAGSLIMLSLLCGLVIDVSWYWANSLRLQRASDAAALAGAIYLPGNVSQAQTAAANAATQNGFTAGGGVTMTNTADAANPRQFDVTISAPVGTFFMRLIGINSIRATRDSKAQYVLPVPMGSPLNYLGIGCVVSINGTQPACATSATPGAASGIADAVSSGTQLPSQGFFGATITKGGAAQNGDAYGPTGDSFGSQTTNPTYNAAGVYYGIVIPAGATGGTVYLYDPTFCAVDASYGTGDHWIGNSGTPVSTYYNLWDTNDTPFDTSNFTLVANSGTRFASQTQADLSKTASTYNFWTAADVSGGSVPTTLTNCGSEAYHNKWWQLASGLEPGRYYLQVTTTSVDTNYAGGTTVLDPSVNSSTNAQNNFALEATVSFGSTPQVFGSGTMVAYNNLNGSSNGGVQQFYLAQIDKTYAGKTLEIDLFDIGDVALSASSQTAKLTVQNPDGGSYNNATFNFSADSLCTSSCSATNVTSITTSTYSGGNTNKPYNDSWIALLITLPTSYGSSSLASSGWWKISYAIPSGVQSNDTTTWKVSVRGNPVHLIVP